MQISPEHKQQKYFIQSFNDQVLTINRQPYPHSVLITMDELIPWQQNSLAELDHSHFEQLSKLDNIEVLLIGTGPKQQFIDFQLQKQLLLQQIGIEVMSTYAACKTYNILIAEGRKVAALLLVQ